MQHFTKTIWSWPQTGKHHAGSQELGIEFTKSMADLLWRVC